MEALSIGTKTREALAAGAPVVALESTIFSRLGLPVSANAACFARVVAAVRQAGAAPALTGVLDGRAVVGADDAQARRLRDCTVKVGSRDLGTAVARGLSAGATTVSATLTLAAAAGIEVVATGGIGGVHRGADASGDVSQDLAALARHRVVVVSSGAKSFLDLPKTLERLESLGVPVVGWRTRRFPAFYTRDSGLVLNDSADGAHQVAKAVRSARALGHPTGMLVANPVPADAEPDAAALTAALDTAEAEARGAGASGGDVTPAVLARVADLQGEAALRANLALAESNASVAAQIAVALSGLARGEP